jgi:hypothetical protein
VVGTLRKRKHLSVPKVQCEADTRVKRIVTAVCCDEHPLRYAGSSGCRYRRTCGSSLGPRGGDDGDTVISPGDWPKSILGRH